MKRRPQFTLRRPTHRTRLGSLAPTICCAVACAVVAGCPATTATPATAARPAPAVGPTHVDAPPMPAQYRAGGAPGDDGGGDAPAGASLRGVVFVTNEDAGTVVVVDVATDAVVATIPVGARPRGVRLSPDETTLFVAVSGSPKGGPNAPPPGPPDHTKDGIAVVDVAARKVTRVIESGDDPEAFDVARDGATLFVSNEDAGTLSIVDVASGKVTQRVPVGGEPEGVTVSRDGARVYVTSERDGFVTALAARDDDKSKRGDVVGKLVTRARPRSIAFTHDGARAFVPAENDASVRVIDVKTGRSLGDIALGDGARPMGLAITRDDGTLFVSNGRGKSIAVVDVASGRVREIVADVGVRPWGIALSPDEQKLYAACGPGNDVAVVDVKSGKVEKRIASAGSPWGVAATRRVLRVCADPNNLPFSNEKGEGFDDAIAGVLADDLDARLVVVHHPERRGLVKTAIKTGLCDVVLDVPAGYDRLLTSVPLYRSSYALVGRDDDAHHRFSSLDDPALKRARIGVHLMGDDGATAPPVAALLARGLRDNITGFTITDSYRRQNPPAALLEAVDRGDIDAAVAWGPLAGWYAKKSAAHALYVTPLPSSSAPESTFDVSVGVKKGERALLDDINRAIKRRRPEIERILDAFGVPRTSGHVRR